MSIRITLDSSGLHGTNTDWFPDCHKGLGIHLFTYHYYIIIF